MDDAVLLVAFVDREVDHEAGGCGAVPVLFVGGGAAATTDHTVGGVLMASFVVLWGSSGLILCVAVLINLWQGWALAAATLLMLLLYASKSIPMTLAKGALPRKDEPGFDGKGTWKPYVETSGML